MQSNCSITTMNHLKISHKLNSAFALIIAIFLLAAGFTAWRVEQVSQATLRMGESAERLKIGSAWQGDVRQNSARSLAVAYAEGTEVLHFFQASMASTTQATNQKQQAYMELANNPRSKARGEKVIEQRKLWLQARDEVNAMKLRVDNQQVQAFVQSRFIPVTDAYVAATQELVDGEVADVAAAQAEVNAMFQQLYVLGGSLIALAAVMALIISWRLSRSISAGVESARAVAQRIGAGDLSHEVHVTRQDEIGQLLAALRDMQSSLSGVVRSVRQGSDSVALASAEIAHGNQDLSARTESQASALEETSASMEQLGSTVQQNADNARQANQLAQNASNVAIQGGQVVAQVVDTMKGISESSTRIADIISVIDGIAFQTNILALNAAVEAARAGEQGRGFAVVAGEVRSLAQRSAEAAKEIKALISTSVSNVNTGSAQVSQAGDSMQEIVSSVRRVTDLIGEISAATSEQRDGFSQVNHAVSNLDQMTQQNAALVEESSAAAVAMNEQAQRLAQVVSVFNVGQETMAMEPPTVSAPLPSLQQRPAAPAAQKKSATPAPSKAHQVAMNPAAESVLSGRSQRHKAPEPAEFA